MTKPSFLATKKHVSRRQAGLFAGIMSVIGIVLVWSIFASGTPIAFETESGVVTSPATIAPNSSASNGQAVHFGSAATPTPTPMPLKPPTTGLIDRGNQSLPNTDKFTMPVAGYAGAAVQGTIVNVNWSSLQQTQNGQIVRNNIIDSALSQLSTWNAGHPTAQLYLKVRIFAGVYAPSWAKTLDGFTPVNIANTQTPAAKGTIGPFWSPTYANAYADFQSKLATIYDSNPLIRDVTNAQCMTVFAEPFQRDNAYADQSPGLFAYLYAHGYTLAADEACFTSSIDAHRVWRQTHVSLALNPFRPWTLQGGTYGQYTTDEAFTQRMMTYCRTTLGNRCLLENNSIRSTFVGNENIRGNLYNDMKTAGPDATYQTASLSRIVDIAATLHWAAYDLLANAVELPNGYETLTPAALAVYAGKLQGNAKAAGE